MVRVLRERERERKKETERERVTEGIDGHCFKLPPVGKIYKVSEKFEKICSTRGHSVTRC